MTGVTSYCDMLPNTVLSHFTSQTNLYPLVCKEFAATCLGHIAITECEALL